MTTSEQETVRLQEAEPDHVNGRDPSPFRVSAAIRAAVAILVAGSVTAAVIVARWAPLQSKSDVIGYPIFTDFNPYNYSSAYDLVIVVFPIAALLIYLGLTWIGQRAGPVAPPSGRRLRPLGRPDDVDPWLAPEPTVPVFGRVAACARVAVVGAVLGLEAGIASGDLRSSILLVLVGYALATALITFALRSVWSAAPTWGTRLAAVNALGALLTVAGLSLVSAHTEVRILADHSVRHYSWFPAWLGVPLAGVLGIWVLRSLRRAGLSAAVTIERRALLLVAVPVALFVLVAHLPGDLGHIGLFEEGQLTTETMLIGHGWLPWKGVVLAHGLLGDVAPTAIGWAIFGNSYWGAFAGASVIFYPVAIAVTYWLLAYLVGRSWPMLVIAALIFAGPWLGVATPFFLSWWLILLLLAAALKRPTRVRAVALGVLVIVQGIVSFEQAPEALAVAVTVVAYEWYWWPAGARLARAFRRTLWLGLGAGVTIVVFAIYMASRGGLGDVISISLDLIGGHFAQGIPPSPSGFPQGRFDFVAFAPVAAMLIAFAYAVVRLRLRRPFLLADWPMGAAALFLLIYYSKFLARMDLPHAFEPFAVATPLLIYIVYRVVIVVDGWIRSRLPTRHARWVSNSPFGIALLVVFLVHFSGPLRTAAHYAPADYRAEVPTAPAFARVGYASQVDGPAIQDLRQIVNAYVGPHGRLLDMTNEPALFYYFLGHDPSSRWFAPNGLVDTAKLQDNLIAQLRRNPPKLIVFDDTDPNMYGLFAMDGVPAPVFEYLISKWVLAHYRPLLESHRRVIYALPGARPVSSLHLHLHQQPVTSSVPFLGQTCIWGDAPNFLSGPGEPPGNPHTVSAPTTVVQKPRVVVSGWAGDVSSGEPARKVIATLNGRIVGESAPDIDRPDVPAAGFPAGFLRSGFSLSLASWANAPRGLRLFAVGRHGSVTELTTPDMRAHATVAKIGSRTATLRPGAETGHVDAETPTGAVLAVRPPAGSSWEDYGWLELDAPGSGGFAPGGFTLSDRPGTPDATNAGHAISFNIVGRMPRRYVVPASSCQQWRGYGSRQLFLTPPPGGQPPSVRLIR